MSSTPFKVASFSGSGSTLTDLNASNISTGTLAVARMGSGTPSSTTYLRGDGSWAAVPAAVPAGATTQIQFNSSGAFAGSSNLTWTSGTNTLTAANFSGNGSLLTSLNASNLSSGTVNAARLGSGTPGATTFLCGDGTWSPVSVTPAGSTTQVQFNNGGLLDASASFTWTPGTSTLAATNFSGNGSAITALNGSNISTGTVATARLGSGTASSSTFLRGDGTWAAPTVTPTSLSGTGNIGITATTGISAGLILGSNYLPGMYFNNTSATTGNRVLAQYTNNSGVWIHQLQADNGSSGTTFFQVDRSGNTATNIAFTGTVITLNGAVTGTSFSGTGTALTALNASNLASGTVATARLGSGTADSTTYLRGDGTWATVTAGASVAGSDTQVQYNSSGALAGSANFTWNNTTSTLAATNFSGNGSAITSLNGSNIASGTVPAARLGSGTTDSSTYLRGDGTWSTVVAAPGGLTTQIQFNNAGVLSGTSALTWTAATSTLTATNISGNGSALTALNASNLASGTVGTSRLGSGAANTGTYLRGDGSWAAVPATPGGATTQIQFNNAGAMDGTSALTWTAGTLTLAATNFSGNGSALTSLNASNIASGTVATARLGTGTASSSTYLRGDGTWSSVTATPGGSTTQIQFNNAGALAGTSALTWTSGTSTLAATNFSGDGSAITNLAAGNIASGTVATARLGTGTASSTTYLRGDGTWASAPNTETFMVVALSDEYTSITAATTVVTFRVPFAMTLTRIPRASLATASSSGGIIVDIKQNGTSILGVNKLSIDASAKTSTTALTPTTLGTSSLTDDAEITMDITSAGVAAKGLKVVLYYTKA